MRKEILKKIIESGKEIIEVIHTLNELIKAVIIALAKPSQLKNKIKTFESSKSKYNISKSTINKTVFTSFVILFIFAVGVNGVTITSVHDDPESILSDSNEITNESTNNSNSSISNNSTNNTTSTNEIICYNCKGTGTVTETKSYKVRCEKCYGKGYGIDFEKCPYCGGTGTQTKNEIKEVICPICHGKGKIPSSLVV